MSDKTQRRWGILTVAVLMFFVTLVITNINGAKSSIYFYVWMMVGYYAYKGKLSDIQTMMKYLIFLNVVVAVLVMIFMDSDNLSYLKNGGKSDLLVGVLVMLAPKILLFFYCKNQLKTFADDPHSSRQERERSSQRGQPKTTPSFSLRWIRRARLRCKPKPVYLRHYSSQCP